MCIAQVSDKKPKSAGFGYKVFKISDDGLHSAFTGSLNPWKTWTKAENKFLLGHQDAGFHIYATREKAEQCVRWYDELWKYKAPQDRPIYHVFKVQYRNATKQGIGDGGYTKNARVILAQEMYIL